VLDGYLVYTFILHAGNGVKEENTVPKLQVRLQPYCTQASTEYYKNIKEYSSLCSLFTSSMFSISFSRSLSTQIPRSSITENKFHIIKNIDIPKRHKIHCCVWHAIMQVINRDVTWSNLPSNCHICCNWLQNFLLITAMLVELRGKNVEWRTVQFIFTSFRYVHNWFRLSNLTCTIFQ
jgi:catabolite regulation protein CreA